MQFLDRTLVALVAAVFSRKAVADRLQYTVTGTLVIDVFTRSREVSNPKDVVLMVSNLWNLPESSTILPLKNLPSYRPYVWNPREVPANSMTLGNGISVKNTFNHCSNHFSAIFQSTKRSKTEPSLFYWKLQNKKNIQKDNLNLIYIAWSHESYANDLVMQGVRASWYGHTCRRKSWSRH